MTQKQCLWAEENRWKAGQKMQARIAKINETTTSFLLKLFSVQQKGRTKDKFIDYDFTVKPMQVQQLQIPEDVALAPGCSFALRWKFEQAIREKCIAFLFLSCMFLFLYKCKDLKYKNVAVNSLGRVERKDSGSLKRWYFMGGIVSQEAKPTLIGITKNLPSYPGSNSN